MRNQLLQINTIFETLPDWIRRRRILLWILFLGVTVGAFVGMRRFKMDMSWDIMFQPDEPVKVAYDRFRAVFGSDEVLYLVYEAKNGDIFSDTSIKTLKALHEELEENRHRSRDCQLSHITDITSLINVSFLEGSEDALISRDFIGDDIPENPTESDTLRRMALNHPDYPRLLCSEDSRFGGIILRTDFNAEIVHDHPDENSVSHEDHEFDFDTEATSDSQSPLDGDIPKFKTTWMEDYVPFMDSIYDIIDKPEYAQHLKFYPVGNTEMMGFLGRELSREMGIIIIGSLFLIMAVLGLLFRSVSAVLWPLLIVVVTILWTIGTIGWSGRSMSDFINIIVFLLIAVGVADAVHILSGYLFFRRKGEEHQAAIKSVYKKSGFACFLTSLTTAAGVLALNFAPIVAVQRLAYFAAAGVMFAFIITVFMLPLMLDILRPNVKPSTKSIPRIQQLLVRFDKIATSKSNRIIILFAIAAAILIPGIFMIKVDSNMLTIIREDKPIRNNFDVVDRHMAGTGNIEILVDTGTTDGMKDPLVLQSLERMQQQLETDFSDIVYKTISLANVTKDAYRVLNENRPEMYKIPDHPDELAQTLFLFGSANPKDRRLLVTDDYRAARVTVNTRNLGSQEGLTFMNEVTPIVEHHFSQVKLHYPQARIEATGQIPMFLRMMDLISWSQIQSFGISLVIISTILFFVLSSVRSGIIAVIPNLFPIMAVFGIMGWLRIPLDVHTLLVVPIIIGISVDDTIHFVTHFQLEMRKHNDVFKAISLTMQEVGQALIFTSVVLAIGYLVFLICVNKGFAYFGFLSSVAVLTALLSDLLLLPVLLSFQSKENKEIVNPQHERETR